MKRVVALLTGIALLFGAAPKSVSAQEDEVIKTETVWEDESFMKNFTPDPNAKVTIDQYLGAKNVEEHMRRHEKDKYYLGTPYKGLTSSYYNKPDALCIANGDKGGKGGAFNCTGFVACVFRNCGGDLKKIDKGRNGWYANGTSWQHTVYNHNLKAYHFKNATEALNSGKLRYGDVIFFEPNDWGARGADCHLGIFCGKTPSDNKFWHSPGENNCITNIYAAHKNSSIYVFPVQHTGSADSGTVAPEPEKDVIPGLVTSISAESKGDSILVSWKAVANAAKYKVFRMEETVAEKPAEGEEPEPAEWILIGTATDTSYLDGEVQEGKTYSYAVCAVSKMGTPGEQSDVIATCTQEKNTDIKAITPQKDALLVEWYPISEASEYIICRTSDDQNWEMIAVAEGSSYTDESVVSGESYNYKVYCMLGEEECGGKAGKLTKYVSEPVISSVKLTNDGPKVTWKASQGADKYRVYRKTTGGWTRLAEIKETSFVDTTAKADTTYYYTVRCVSENASTFTSSYDKAGTKFLFAKTPVLTAASNTATGAKVTWEASKGVEKYLVYRKTEGGSWGRVGTTTGTSYTDKTAENGTYYIYTVRCLNEKDELISFHNSSGVKTLYLSQNALTKCSNVATRAISAGWNKNSKATGYQIQYSTSSTFASGNKSVKVTSNATVTKKITSLTKGKTYYVRVRNYKTKGDKTYYSAWSEKKSVKISK